MESHEDRESVITIDSLPRDVAHSQFTYVPELHTPPRLPMQPHVFTSISERYEETLQEEPWPVETRPVSEAPSTILTERNDTHSMTEMIDTSHLYPRQPYQTATETDHAEAPAEPPIVVRKPEVTSHLVDDVFLRTITEKTTIEDIEKYKQKITEYKAKPIPSPTWDVTIRNYPTDDRPQWEDFSDVSSVTPPTPPRVDSQPPQPAFIDESGEKLTSPELVGNMKPVEIPPEDKSVPNWDVLIRVLEESVETLPMRPRTMTTSASMPAPGPEPTTTTTTTTTVTETNVIDDTTTVTQRTHTDNILQRQISYEDKLKWRDIITTESTLRTMLKEATIREDFERIRSDTRYETLFEPQTWDVIIRILAPPEPEEVVPRRNRKKEPWDTRSRRSSLPTLYEYDSDGGSSVRTIPQEYLPTGSSNTYQYPPQSRRTSRSSFNAENIDMRSMSEVIVDFGRPNYPDNVSDVSSFYPNR